tara:strand:- start:4925 stop:5488 length:564 start_codon:yes stop_codon:yes gene_type:complete
MNKIKNLIIYLIFPIFLYSCNGKLPGADARKIPYDPKERVKRNLEQGKGFRLDESFGKSKGGDFEFASSNPLWRASLDTIDFMPLALANYSGGILSTDWYSDGENTNEAIKITIRFLTNEVRSDALSIKIFYKKCEKVNICSVSEQKGNLKKELNKEILKKAAVYAKETEDKDFKPYNSGGTRDSKS